ncbi:MAG: TetR family transcriptional regulator [Microbacteriaceae bacterium]|nr:TetR family transcriptional regulator [Microbacteriaceae bacterium]
MAESFAVEQSRQTMSTRQTDVFRRLVALTLEYGFSRYTLEQAAAALRCSKTTIYALAGSREQLIRAVVVSFFRDAADNVEHRVAAETDPIRRVEVYLGAVSDALRPASAIFMDDVAAFAPAREIYQRNTAIATQRVSELISEGIESGAFKSVPIAYIAEVMTSVMVRIQQGEFSKHTGLTDAEAYAGLADVIMRGIVRQDQR